MGEAAQGALGYIQRPDGAPAGWLATTRLVATGQEAFIWLGEPQGRRGLPGHKRPRRKRGLLGGRRRQS
jgi:hypothetical protein